MKTAILFAFFATAVVGCSTDSGAGSNVADGSTQSHEVDSSGDATLLREGGVDAPADLRLADAPVDSTVDGAVDSAIGPSTCVTMSIGPAGGSILHPRGGQLNVPVGALAIPTQLALCAEAPPQLPKGTLVGPAFEAGPEGQTFVKPVEIVLPFDATRVSPGAPLDSVQIQMASHGASNFGALQSSVELVTGLARASTTHFTQFVPAQTPAPVFITTSPSLPDATAGVAYSQQFTASGGAPPYTWTVPPSGALPPGLSLSTGGLLTGVPTVPNNYGFFVEATDSANASVEMAVSLTVNPANNPVPTLIQVTPSSTSQGSAATTITLSGTGFVPTTQVLWDTAPLPATLVSATTVAASIAATDLINAGTHQVSVSNPPPGGGASMSVTFTVTPATLNPVPSIVSVAPTQLPISTVDVQVSLTGTNFISLSSAVIGSQGIATNYTSSTQLLAAIPSAYVSTAGTLQVGVFNPPPGGGFSATSVTVTVGTLNPIPMLASLSPTSVGAGSGAFTLATSGTNFVNGAQVFLGSTALATTFVNATTVEASVPAYLVATPGSADVVVVNPTPGGGASNAVTLVIGPALDGGAVPCNVPCSANPPSTAQCIDDGGACLVTLAAGQNAPYAFAIDSANIYWTLVNDGKIAKAPLGGGPVTTLASGQHYPFGIAVDGTSVYWTSSRDGTVMKVPVAGVPDGGSPTTLASGQNDPTGIAVDATNVYWTNYAADGGVMTVPVAGTPGGAAPITLASAQNGPLGITVDAQNVYWINQGDNTVMKVPVGGGIPVTLANGPINSSGFIAIDTSSVYWTGDNEMLKAPLSGVPEGGSPMTFPPVAPAVGIAVDGSHVYWTNYSVSPGGTVMKVLVDGGSPTVLGSGQTMPLGVAIDGTSVYWNNYVNDAGALMKLTPR